MRARQLYRGFIDTLAHPEQAGTLNLGDEGPLLHTDGRVPEQL